MNKSFSNYLVEMAKHNIDLQDTLYIFIDICRKIIKDYRQTFKNIVTIVDINYDTQMGIDNFGYHDESVFDLAELERCLNIEGKLTFNLYHNKNNKSYPFITFYVDVDQICLCDFKWKEIESFPLNNQKKAEKFIFDYLDKQIKDFKND